MLLYINFNSKSFNYFRESESS